MEDNKLQEFRMNIDFLYDPKGPYVYYETAQGYIDRRDVRLVELEKRVKELDAEVARQEEVIRMLLLDKAKTHLDMAILLNQR